MTIASGNSALFFLWDYDGTLFPLRTNRLIVERYCKEVLEFIQSERLNAPDAGFQTQHRVFATKKGWFQRATYKLDPVAELFFYDFVYRNRHLFRRAEIKNREVYGFRIANGEPVPILASYSAFKKATAACKQAFRHCIYFDVASYFNRIYHHDLIRWCEDAGASSDDVNIFGKFLREIAAGRSVDCLPQGIYPSKMVGSSFLGFLETSSRLRSARILRLMDDVWLFDDDPDTLIADFLIVQSLLSDRGLCVNEEKSKVLTGHVADLPPNLNEMKIQLLQKRREELTHETDYGDSSDEATGESELLHLSPDEQEYLLSLLRGGNIQEEDAELVLTLMREHSTDVLEFIPTLISEFPGLAKRLYYFCSEVDDKASVVSMLKDFVDDAGHITEYQLFWFGKMLDDYLLRTRGAGDLLMALYEHDDATDITRAKILEIPDKRFGLSDLREEQLRTGHSDWLVWSAAVGSRVHAKGQRNQLLKYFRKSSPMNRLIGEFVETCF